jgi:predicted hydrolase (HD superfamily)
MLAVEAVMRHYARAYGENQDEWGLIGLLHDFDWEIHPDLGRHPQDGAPILRARGVAEDIIRSVLSHADHTGVQRSALRDRVLYASDELTGLISAVALVRPSRSLADLTPASVRKKWKDRAFAAGVNREDIERGTRELGLDLWEHVGNVIAAMRTIAPELGLGGTGTDPCAGSAPEAG